MFAYVVSDFSISNVYQNSHSAKPLLYKITGVWGNHEVSILLWLLVMTFFGYIFSCQKKIDENLLDKFEELLIESDVGTQIASDIKEKFKKEKIGKEIKDEKEIQILINTKFCINFTNIIVD